jgi:hypothetical protein
MPAYIVKEHVANISTPTFTFANAKTMYGGRKIAAGDVVYIFDSETQGGSGLCARGVVTEVIRHVKPQGRVTPRVSIKVRRTAKAIRPFGRRELKGVAAQSDARPETEIWFKFYRQATNKIGGISENGSRFLDQHF